MWGTPITVLGHMWERKPGHSGRDASVSLHLMTVVFTGQDFAVPHMSALFVLGRTDPGESVHHLQ